MMEKILTRSIRAICVGGMALGMTTAMAQEASVVMQQVETVDGESLAVVAYSDPESEVGNGLNPPNRIATSPEAEDDDDIDVPMEVDNFPEGEVGNGTSPPNLNPMAQNTSVALQQVEAVDGERLVVVAYSDPETEVGNGTKPPNREANSETEARDDLDVPMEADNFPETEIGNGTSPPNVNP
jgi:hypothetical protein